MTLPTRSLLRIQTGKAHAGAAGKNTAVGARTYPQT